MHRTPRFFHLILSLSLLAACFVTPGQASAGGVLTMEVRHRPPEMFVEGQSSPTGPLIDVFLEAAANAGYRVEFVKRQFQGSLLRLSQGVPLVLPRTIRTPERAKFMDFIGPVGSREHNISFLVRKGQEHDIASYVDLSRLAIGVKRGTAYFERFDQDSNLTKIPADDDDNLVNMFRSGRFDTMIVLDKPAVEAALRKYGITDYAFADYVHKKKIGYYYAVPKGFPDEKPLQQALEQMVRAGRVREIYRAYGLEPPDTAQNSSAKVYWP